MADLNFEEHRFSVRLIWTRLLESTR